jgi:hypothetical protein
MTPPLITLPQNCETEASVEWLPAPELPGGIIGLTYLYARSRDSRTAGTTGQDFLAYRWDQDRVIFVLCDGVSQSFYGEIAARFLGERLAEALWTQPQLSPWAMGELLTMWVTDGSAAVQAKRIGAHLPEMHRVALERKREVGSETMFLAGYVDRVKRVLSVYYMGDMTLSLWDHDGESLPIPDAQFLTKERWSTLHGMKNGTVRYHLIPLDPIAHFTAHSDGVGRYGSRFGSVAQDMLNSMAEELVNQPASDDISVLDIDFTLKPIFGVYHPLNTPQVQHSHPDQPLVQWKHVGLTTRYRIAVQIGDEQYTDELMATLQRGRPFTEIFQYVVRVKPEQVGQSITVQVQGLNDYTYPSQWSAPVSFPATMLTHPLEPALPFADSPTQPKKPRAKSKKKKSRAVALLIVAISCLILIALIVTVWLGVVLMGWSGLSP